MPKDRLTSSSASLMGKTNVTHAIKYTLKNPYWSVASVKRESGLDRLSLLQAKPIAASWRPNGIKWPDLRVIFTRQLFEKCLRDRITVTTGICLFNSGTKIRAIFLCLVGGIFLESFVQKQHFFNCKRITIAIDFNVFHKGKRKDSIYRWIVFSVIFSVIIKLPKFGRWGLAAPNAWPFAINDGKNNHANRSTA